MKKSAGTDLTKSRQLSREMIVTELRKRERLKKLKWIVPAALTVVGAGACWWMSAPRGFTVTPGFQDARVVANGTEFKIEVSEEGKVRATLVPERAGEGSWKATLDGLKQGHEYSACWVTESGRRGG